MRVAQQQVEPGVDVVAEGPEGLLDREQVRGVGLRRRTGRERGSLPQSRFGATRANPSRAYMSEMEGPSAAARLASTSRRAGSFVCTPALYLPKEPWLAETFESPSPSRARSASGVTTKPKVEAEQSGPDRAPQVLPLVRPAYAAQGDPLTAGSARAWHVTVSGQSSVRPSAARGGSPARTAGRADEPAARRRPDHGRARRRARSARAARPARRPRTRASRAAGRARPGARRPTHARPRGRGARSRRRRPTTRPTRRSRTGRSRTPRRRRQGRRRRGRLRGPRPPRARRRGPQGPAACHSVPRSRSGPSCSVSNGRTARPGHAHRCRPRLRPDRGRLPRPARRDLLRDHQSIL